MPLCTHGDPAWVVTWARPSRLLAADGVTLKQQVHAANTAQNVAANGDRIQLFFIARGNETRFVLGSYGTINQGIFDIYVNGILDSAGYDNYLPADAIIHRYILLTQPPRAGANVIELRINGRNGASTGYLVMVYGASLQ